MLTVIQPILASSTPCDSFSLTVRVAASRERRLTLHVHRESLAPGAIWAGAVIFIHIPKAAGSTLKDIIRAQYPEGTIFEIDNVKARDEDLERLSSQKLASLRCVHGHTAFGVHRLLPNPSTYITLLRQPVERIISHYYWVKSHPNHYLYQRVMVNNLSLLDYATLGLDQDLDNGQARFITGLWDSDSHSELLTTAKRNLTDSFLAFGPVERFDGVLGLFHRRLGWRLTPYVRQNVTANRLPKSAIDSHTIQRIEKVNAADMELYDWSTGRFDEMLREYNIPNR